jgi:hypothetical protein
MPHRLAAAGPISATDPTFSWPRIRGDRSLEYDFTSDPHTPAASMAKRPSSAPSAGAGNSPQLRAPCCCHHLGNGLRRHNPVLVYPGDPSNAETGLEAIEIMISGRTSAVLLRRRGSSAALRIGVVTQPLSAAVLVAAVALHAHLWVLLAPLWLDIFSVGLVVPNSEALALDQRASRAGTPPE